MLRSRLFALLVWAVAAAAAGPAAAQLPNLGGVAGGVLDQTPLRDVEGDVQGLTREAVRDLRQAREEAVRRLRRQHRDVIDSDPSGAAVIRNEVVAVAPSNAGLQAAQALGFSVAETLDADALGLRIVVLRAPQGLSTRRALEALRAADPEGAYDYNHVYLGAAELPRSPVRTRQSSEGGAGGARIGLIDSGVDARHPAFAGASLRQRGFAGGEAVADTHGGAVASLLLAAAPGATLYVADVYGGRPSGGGASSIVAALAWFAQAHVTVINISLVGPPNRALQAGVNAAIARGHVVVAAVGNDGPAAPPLYPAAYAGVIGVTGVDARNRALPEALRGAQVDFSAPGAEVSAAAAGGRFTTVRGTSFAAPIVAGLLARRMHEPGAAAAARAQADLAETAGDLGARGRDDVFGLGLVGQDLRRARVARR